MTTLHAVPSMLQALWSSPETGCPESLRRSSRSARCLPADTAARFVAAATAELFNLYGPTEAAVSVTGAARRGHPGHGSAVPIGGPDGTRDCSSSTTDCGPSRRCAR
ncbi:hypothetical protein GS444_21950 [Rhodococcus hoagii]|nr:hypothetical protein [Prescottella equi]